MKTLTCKDLRPGLGRPQWVAAIAATLLATARLMAMPDVATLTGGPSQSYPQTAYGYVDGFTDTDAKFHTPCGLALDSVSGFLYVADRDNNAVRLLDLAGNWTYTFVPNEFVPASLISKPVGVALDTAGGVYVLNRGNGNNGTVLQFDGFGELVKTNATGLTNAAGIALDGNGNIYLTIRSNTVIRVAPNGLKTTVATIASAGASLQGLVFKLNGQIAVCDSGRNGIYLINPISGVVTTNAGFHGAGDFQTNGNNTASSSTAKFNQPYGVAEAGDGTLIVADYGNHRAKVVLTTGVVTNLYGVRSNLWVQGAAKDGIFPGWWDGTVSVPDLLGGVEARLPVGVAFAPDGTVYTTESYYHLIRAVTSTGLPPPPPPPPAAPVILGVTTNYGQVSLSWSTVSSATNYFVKRSTQSGGPYTTLASTTGTSYADNSVINGTTYYYVVSASNAGGEGLNSTEVIATPPVPPVPDPQVGYVDFPATASPIYSSVFHQVSAYDFYNDATIIIKGTPGSGTYYTVDGSTPTPQSGSVPSDYQDGLYNVSSYTIPQVGTTFTIKAMGAQTNRPSSAVVQATFQFKTGNPVLYGNNAAQFSVSDITASAQLYYTIDGSDPSPANVNGSTAFYLGTVPNPTNLWTINRPIETDTWFKFRAFRDNYQPSAVVSNKFLATNSIPNRISFGLTNGEPSSAFIARPGQVFYAPVTLKLQPGGETLYSLQFNVGVTNGLENPLTGVRPPALVNGAGINFFSMLMSQVPANEGTYFPPADGLWYLRIPPVLYESHVYYLTNANGSITTNYASLPFAPSVFTNSANNLLGVGWIYRTGFKYWYFGDPTGEQNIDFDTTKQDLIDYSIPHDTLFTKDNGVVVVGAYSFQVPNTATNGDKYFIQLGSPSGTRDGVGAPGAAVYIRPPANNQAVTVGAPSYLVGDAAPFRWFNAGDFGNSNLLNDDVMQVYQSAILGVDMPPTNSDLFASMDSCGTLGTWDAGNGYYVNGGPMSVGQIQAMFDGSDATINEVAFGDNPPSLDICDVYVTFRRSLDPSLLWFRRFWANGQLVAITNANLAFNSNNPSLTLAAKGAPVTLSSGGGASTTYQDSSALFISGDAIASAGQTIQIPITAKVLGNYSIRVVGLNITVSPLDGSPPLTQTIQFTPAAGLGQPTFTSSRHMGNFSGAWLNNAITGLSGNATLGTLTVRIPAGAGSSAAYAIRFDHASASPNGIASLPMRTATGLITLANRSASSWNDGISDAWRLRYFGTLNNLLSAATADADGDGANNLQESKAGTDPNDAASVLRLRSNKGQSQDFVIRWPSGANKQYVVERSPSLSLPSWSAISTNAGTGWEIEFHDTSAGPLTRFYRVRAQD